MQEIPHHLFAIEFGTDLDGTQDFFQLFWPIVLSHRIDEASPLWSVSPTDLITEKFEIILTMEGTTPETGNNIQVFPSYYLVKSGIVQVRIHHIYLPCKLVLSIFRLL